MWVSPYCVTCLWPHSCAALCNSGPTPGLLSLVLLCLVTGNGSDLFISLVMSIYPGYMSIKVAEYWALYYALCICWHIGQAVLSKTPEDDLRWLKYWIIVSVFMVVQIPADWVLAWAPGFSIGNDLSLVNMSTLWCQYLNMSTCQHISMWTLQSRFCSCCGAWPPCRRMEVWCFLNWYVDNSHKVASC